MVDPSIVVGGRGLVVVERGVVGRSRGGTSQGAAAAVLCQLPPSWTPCPRHGKELQSRAQHELAAAVEVAGAGNAGGAVEIRAELSHQYAPAALVARSESAAMVVVGRRGLGEFTGGLVGPVSSAVVRHAHCAQIIPGLRRDEPADPDSLPNGTFEGHPMAAACSHARRPASIERVTFDPARLSGFIGSWSRAGMTVTVAKEDTMVEDHGQPTWRQDAVSTRDDDPGDVKYLRPLGLAFALLSGAAVAGLVVGLGAWLATPLVGVSAAATLIGTACLAVAMV